MLGLGLPSSYLWPLPPHHHLSAGTCSAWDRHWAGGEQQILWTPPMGFLLRASNAQGYDVPAEGPWRCQDQPGFAAPWPEQGCGAGRALRGNGQSKGAVRRPPRSSIPHNAIMYCWH